MKHDHVALIYNAFRPIGPESPHDRGSTADLRRMIRSMARVLRHAGFQVTVVPFSNDLLAFQRRIRRLRPDVVFNQYDDVVDGALYEMRVAALIQMMGIPLTGSPALAIGLGRHKHTSYSLLQGAGVPIPPNTVLIERMRDLDRHVWSFPIIAQPSREHGGAGLDRASVVTSKRALRDRIRQLLQTYRQPIIVQGFLPGREFNVAILGGRRLTVLPLAEVDYSQLPTDIPPIMSYAAKWMEHSIEYRNTSVICPAEVEPELAEEVKVVALQAFRAVGGWGYGRVDIRLDDGGRPRVLEVNCNCSLEDGMGLARSAARAGIPYPQLLRRIVKIAMETSPSLGVGISML